MMIDDDWRKERVSSIERAIEKLGNDGKWDREKFCVKKLLSGLGMAVSENELTQCDEPCDVSFRGASFQVKELMDKGRRRTDDYKAALERAKTAEREEDLLEEHDLIDVTFEDAALQCWIAAKSYTSRYGRREARQVDFLFYFNKVNYHIQYSGAPSVNSLAFRSLSVIAGNFCCVLYAHDGAPEFLRQRIGMVHGSS